MTRPLFGLPPFGWLLACVAAAGLCGLAQPARAAGCDAAQAAPVEIARIDGDLDIVLKDDRSIRLAGIKTLSAGESGAAGDARLAEAAKAALQGHAATLDVLSPIADRWGRIEGDLFADGSLLQSALVRSGLAVARPDDIRGPCWEAIKAAEVEARRSNAGVWASTNAILDAGDGTKLAARDGLFTLASGRVRHTSHGKGRSYVDFGARGVNALFLMIDNKALTRMEKQGFKLEQLNDRKILVRGVVLLGKSPHMVIDDVDAIEFWD